MTKDAAMLLLLRGKLRNAVTFCALEMRHREKRSVCDSRELEETKTAS
jgi:hypothetical protein